MRTAAWNAAEEHVLIKVHPDPPQTHRIRTHIYWKTSFPRTNPEVLNWNQLIDNTLSLFQFRYFFADIFGVFQVVVSKFLSEIVY
jgi:hypothetical protein